VDHFRVEMAGRSGGDRLGDEAGRANPLRVVVGRQVSGQHADLGAAAERAGSRLEHGGLAGAGRSHQVDRADLAIAKVLPVVARRAVVGGQDPLVERDRHDVRVSASTGLAHHGTSSSS
jgi:hypothetical protein